MGRFSSYIWKHSHKITNSLFQSDPGCERSSLVTFFPYSIKKEKRKRKRRRCSGGEVGAASFAIRNVVVE
jgi:DNA repair exonuclease SbcCD ATPase subunit